MSTPVTKDTISRTVDRIKKVHRARIEIDWAYGRGRVQLEGGGTYLSPRLPNRQLQDWLYAFESGMDYLVMYGSYQL